MPCCRPAAVTLILSTFVEGLHWRGGLIVEHVPQKSSHHNDLPATAGKMIQFSIVFCDVSLSLSQSPFGIGQMWSMFHTLRTIPNSNILCLGPLTEPCSWNRVCVVLLERSPAGPQKVAWLLRCSRPLRLSLHPPALSSPLFIVSRGLHTPHASPVYEAPADCGTDGVCPTRHPRTQHPARAQPSFPSQAALPKLLL